MSAFAQEVKSANSRVAAHPVPAPAAADAASVTEPNIADAVAAALKEGGAEVDASDVMNTGLPIGNAPVDPKKAAEIPQEPAKKADAPADIPKIKIAGKEFANMEEAIKYAEELELARREDDAFKEGFKEAKKADEKPVPPAKTYIEEAEELLFEDPKKALEIVREGVRKEIFEAYDKMTVEQKAETQRQEQLNNLWTGFYSENADLAEAKEYVDFLLKKNWDSLKDVPVSKSLPELAEMARKGLRITRQNALPGKELPSKPANMAGASGNATGAQSVVTQEKSVDFVSQLNTIRKRK